MSYSAASVAVAAGSLSDGVSELTDTFVPQFQNNREAQYALDDPEPIALPPPKAAFTDNLRYKTTKHKVHKAVFRVNPATGYGANVWFYPTVCIPHNTIKHAMTGEYQFHNGRACRVGTKDEFLFFSHLLATGETGNTAEITFYDSPEQFEQHFHVRLPTEQKNAWRTRRDHHLHVLQNDHAERMYRKSVVVK
jgi:hypothetical protein